MQGGHSVQVRCTGGLSAAGSIHLRPEGQMKQLPLPISLAQVQSEIFSRALPAGLDSPEARVMLLAIGLQESRFAHRLQVGGPARGFWQFERGGGIKGVLTHSTSKARAIAFCMAAGVAPTIDAAYQAVAEDDVLACQFARLLLLTDPQPLPALGEQMEAWGYYLRNWRPGKPHPKTWSALYQQALKAVAP